jgi:Ca-activated chloride channel family protein
MITAMLLGLLQLTAPSSAPAPVDEVGGGDVVFTRVEPHLAAGARALAANDPELALERYRRAEATTDEQRAVVEYNVGQALLLQAMTLAAAQQQPATNAAPTPGAEPAAPPPPPDVGDALSSFERAASLGKAPTFISEARLAAGNAALVGNKLDDAIAQLRKALVADPRNERARHNLQRALDLKKQQPPQQNDGDGEKNDDKKDKDDDKKDSEQKNDNGEQKNDEQKNDSAEQKSDEQKNDSGEQKSDEQKSDSGEQKGDEQKNEGEQKKGDEQKDDKSEQKPAGADGEPKPAPKKPTSREEARRLLEGVRSREKPLSPIEMRGAERRPAENGKDW